MVTIRNRKRAPIVCNIPVTTEEGTTYESLYFLALETKTITEEQFAAPEVKEQVAAGNLVVLRIE